MSTNRIKKDLGVKDIINKEVFIMICYLINIGMYVKPLIK
jgi:hypothetical protein